jgi:predicted nucleic acid-binding protein
MGLKEYFFDTYAAIELMKQNQSYSKYLDSKIRITFLNLLEITYITMINFGVKESELAYSKFKEFVVDVPDEVVMLAIEFRAQNKRKSLSYADCLGYMFARYNNLIFLTGDDAFDGMPAVEFVK